MVHCHAEYQGRRKVADHQIGGVRAAAEGLSVWPMGFQPAAAGELPPPALQRGEPHAQQHRHLPGPCTGRPGGIKDLQGLAAIFRRGQSPSSSPQ